MIIKICKNCNEEKEITEFYSNRGKPASQCKICVKSKQTKYYSENSEKAKDYYQKNKDRINEVRRKNPNKNIYWKEYYEKNKEVLLEKKRLYKKANREKIRIYENAYKKANRKRYTYLQNLRHARQLQAMPKWLTEEQKNEIKHIYETCPDGYHVDHIIPLRGKEVSGLHVPWNLQHLPAIENSKKTNKL